MKNTLVINLLGGPGSGKSTASADLFKELKLMGKKVELVREVVKSLAYEGIKPDIFYRPYLFGCQTREEAKLFGKVDIIVTDSPLYLDAFYETRYTGSNIIQQAVVEYLAEVQKKGIVYVNFLMKRTKQYQLEGRYESEAEAKDVDTSLKLWLDERNVKYTYVDADDKDKAKYIINHLEGKI